MVRLSGVAFVLLAVLIGGVLLRYAPTDASRTAQVLSAVKPVQTTFLEPEEVTWTGDIHRIFVSGEGLEIGSRNAQGGVFQAYMPQGEVSPVTRGTVTVHGLWRGWTCAYGGHAGRCVPEVDILTIEAYADPNP